jgi:hypothetical protein
MSNRFILGISLAFFAVLIAGFVAAVGITNMPAPTPATPQTVATAPAPAPEPVAVEPAAPDASLKLSPPAILPVVPTIQAVPLQPTGILVNNSDLDQLAAAVNLDRAGAGGVSKEVWIRETPVAEKLLQGLCDCDQRNWLKHFVKTGDYAIAGSEDYYSSVQLLAQMRRSDQDLSVNRSNQ